MRLTFHRGLYSATPVVSAKNHMLDLEHIHGILENGETVPVLPWVNTFCSLTMNYLRNFLNFKHRILQGGFKQR